MALAIKHLTASEKVVALVNKYGHCCAPKTILRFKTNLADDNISSQAEDNIIISSNVSPGSFIQALADNTDFQEETLDRKLTTHATTMVLYQRQTNLSNVDTDLLTHRPKRKQTSTLNHLPSHVYSIKEFNVSGKRPNPDNLLGNVDLSWYFTPHKASKLEVEQLDQAWILCRMCPTKLFTVNIDNPTQCIPGWSAFIASASSHCPELSIVGFCSMLPAPATDYATIFTVMDNSKIMMEKTWSEGFCVNI